MDLPVLYEDTDVVAINKPAGLVTHTDGRTVEETAEDWFIEKYKSGKAARLEREDGYVHRLDRDTSGVLVFAKNPTAYQFLRKAFHDRDVQKTYLAFVYGAPKEKKGVINFDIGRSRTDFRLRSAQPKAKGHLRDALTRYEVVATTEVAGETYALMEVKPETGRTHQIRVHLKAIHHPIIGDPLYAPKRKAALGLTRLALHAYKIELPLLTGAKVEIVAPLAQDFAAALGHFPRAHAYSK